MGILIDQSDLFDLTVRRKTLLPEAGASYRLAHDNMEHWLNLARQRAIALGIERIQCPVHVPTILRRDGDLSTQQGFSSG